MVKLMNFLVRRPGMSKAEFRAHYENSHVPLALKTFPQILEHRRSYPEEGGAFFPEGVELPWDCVSELWFADRKGFDDLLAFMGDPVASAEIAADGELFIDGTRSGMLLVDETVTTRS